jgi:hypothetical protein
MNNVTVLAANASNLNLTQLGISVIASIVVPIPD